MYTRDYWVKVLSKMMYIRDYWVKVLSKMMYTRDYWVKMLSNIIDYDFYANSHYPELRVTVFFPIPSHTM